MFCRTREKKYHNFYITCLINDRALKIEISFYQDGKLKDYSGETSFESIAFLSSSFHALLKALQMNIKNDNPSRAIYRYHEIKSIINIRFSQHRSEKNQRTSLNEKITSHSIDNIFDQYATLIKPVLLQHQDLLSHNRDEQKTQQTLLSSMP
jgi:hypothetical protein